MGLLNSKLPNRFLLENAPEHLKFIGLIAVNHAHLDRKLCRLFSLLAGLDSRAAKTFLGRSPMHALAPGAYSKTRIVAAGQSGATRDLRGPREACHEHLTQMSDSAFGVGQHGLITAPSNDECGDLMPFAKGELGRLADDIAECAEQLDRFCVYLRP